MSDPDLAEQFENIQYIWKTQFEKDTQLSLLNSFKNEQNNPQSLKEDIFQQLDKCGNSVILKNPIDIAQLNLAFIMYKINRFSIWNLLIFDDTLSSEKIEVGSLQLFKKKNADYGNSFVDFGQIGILVRIVDKLNRILTLTNSKRVCVDDEPLVDCYRDLYNYSILYVLAGN